MDLSARQPLDATERAMIAQECQIALLDGISRTGPTFAGRGMFHGGTCLATCHASGRWSEDLDFVAASGAIAGDGPDDLLDLIRTTPSANS
ncbi:hypothetical protein PARPLA_03341 [Rhodobacteraceae bacterium THAF1]|uniref:nucleotidyl transferase AbiEii/AbiGii toxin family protein n=1 Tax=Palleronia sp. THAF1 TaxID=2587842 RepID=UPI000F3FBF94|nr:nucleotidyl transferase AbiEii/AbiGii toxin family protein [Palleronia sp. THAF1]QFU10353.1 hypothetical protein FIU81_16850 [Palleronia sp. THAF1]VDC31472.1 hypothetical protein PARPLA_03341 [Rhodobacteraceae bacterium THAF1]